MSNRTYDAADYIVNDGRLGPGAVSGLRTRRVFAFLIDAIIIALLTFAVGVVVFFLGIVTLGLGWMLYPILWPAVALVYCAFSLGGPYSATVGMRTQGIEADFRAAIADGLTISGAAAYLDFEFTNFTDGQCYYLQTPGAGGFCDYTGKRNALSPKWSGNLNLDYVTPISSSMKVAFNVNADFSSAYIASANLDPRTRQDGYAKLGARLALAQIDNQWEVALIGRNLTNKVTTSQGFNTPTFGGNSHMALVGAPRTVTLQLSLDF